MARRTALALGALVAIALGCADFERGDLRARPCDNDSQCRGGEVCFPDGCGDPGKDIAVEVTANASTGLFAQDLALTEIRPTLDLHWLGPSAIEGELLQQSIDGSRELPYAGEVTVRVQGESALIPGRSRLVEYTVQPEQGAFAVPAPAGVFTVTAITREKVLPPLLAAQQVIAPASVLNLDFVFPSVESLHRLDGRLVHRIDKDLPVLATAMQIQAFDPVTLRPLSQPAAVSSGQPTSTGDFILYLERPKAGDQVLLRARAVDPSALVPSKSFTVSLQEALQTPLELGDYGEPVEIVGVAVGPLGSPVPEAAVFVEGKVRGGGTFRTQAVQTAVDGSFALRTLPSTDTPLQVWVVPPATSGSGVLFLRQEIAPTGGSLGKLACPAKVEVVGTLVRPDETVAARVALEAEPVAAVDDAPLPHGITRAMTDETGAFRLQLDPAVYRLDFLPSDQLPRVSRFVTIKRSADPEVALPTFTLSKGRRVTGQISASRQRLISIPEPAPYATVRFFRVISDQGPRPFSLLLAEGVADETGSYSVILPSR
jgi:hypothetical protein